MIERITPCERKSSPIFALVSCSASGLRCGFDCHRRRPRGFIMTSNEPIRRDVLQALAAAPFMALLAQASEAHAQVGVSPVRVDTKGLVAKIKFEAPLEGFLK